VKLAAVLLVALAACASSHQTAATQPPGAMPPDRHAEIDSLSQQIDDARRQLSLSAPVSSTATPVPAPAPFNVPVSFKTDDKCHPAQTQSCTDTCTISDTICSNSDKICKLAAELVGDTWAAQKCDTAKQTCDAAHAKCCACAP